MNGEVSKRPNVIVCLCDQLPAFEVGCYGNPVIRTPHIDRLAAEGVRFEVACSNNPVCTPARSILLTGQYSRTCTGTLGNVAFTPPSPERVRLLDPTLPEAFRAAGYHTALIGKWHVHPHPSLVGFDYALYPHHNHRYTQQTYFENDGPGLEVNEFSPLYEAARVKSYLREHRDEPFFLFYNISLPHNPIADAPEQYTRMYTRDEVPLRDNVFVNGNMVRDEHWFKIYCWDFLYYKEHLPHTEHLPEDFDLRDLTALHYGMTTCVDDCVGELMDALAENGLANDTIVLFVSDHGDNLGSHGYFNKDLLIEESIRIPMVFHWPAGLQPGIVTAQVSSLVDVMPTLLHLAGLPAAAHVQGTDVAPVLRREVETVGENVAFIEDTNAEIGVRTLTHVYGILMEKRQDTSGGAGRAVIDERHMFHDLRDDPYELTNLAKTSEQSDLAASLRERVLRWDRETPWREIAD